MTGRKKFEPLSLIRYRDNVLRRETEFGCNRFAQVKTRAVGIQCASPAQRACLIAWEGPGISFEAQFDELLGVDAEFAARFFDRFSPLRNPRCLSVADLPAPRWKSCARE